MDLKHPEYLEIYPSEVAAKKISKHLDSMIKIKPRVYRKTLMRYKKLAYVLLDCVTKIIKMIQSEMLLSSNSAEFQELVSDFDIEEIDELRDSVDSLGNLVEKKSSPESRKLAGDTIKLYKAVFHQAAQHDFGYFEVNDCAKLLDYWISHRFSGFNTNFKYQIRQLPVWATFIVIAYGKYRSVGQATQFITDFKSWCDELDDDVSNCWALPYNVFNMTKIIDPSNFTVDAMIIYDLLIEGSLYTLVDTKIPMDPAYVAKSVKEYRPDKSYEVRMRFTKQTELIESLCLHSTATGMEVDA